MGKMQQRLLENIQGNHPRSLIPKKSPQAHKSLSNEQIDFLKNHQNVSHSREQCQPIDWSDLRNKKTRPQEAQLSSFRTSKPHQENYTISEAPRSKTSLEEYEELEAKVAGECSQSGWGGYLDQVGGHAADDFLNNSQRQQGESSRSERSSNFKDPRNASAAFM